MKACDAGGVVAAPFGGRDQGGPHFVKLEAAEETGGALLGGACEDILEAAGARLLDNFADKFDGDALALEARQSVESGNFACELAMIRLLQQRADAGEVFVTDAVAEA